MKAYQKERVILKPFVVAYSEDATRPTKRAGQHLSKDKATKEVLNRLVERVKGI